MRQPADVADLFRQAMQRYPAAVTVVTTDGPEGPAGLMATAVCSLSAEPPSILICVNRTATAHDAILRNGIIGVSLVPQEDEAFAATFAKAKGADRFLPATCWTRLQTGAPIYAGATLAFDCTITQVVPAHTHSVIFAEIRDILIPEGCAPDALLWHGRGFARLAPAEAQA